MHVKEIALFGILTGFGLILLVLGIVFTFTWPGIFDSILAKELQLTPTSKSYDAWKSPPIELSLDIYLWNWTNPEEFKNNTKPRFEQLGPYRFTEKPDKVDIKFNPHNSTVTFRRLSQFFFDEEGSSGSLDDMVSTVNVVALSAAEKARFADYMKAKSISVGLSLYQQQISVTKTAGELLFEGYEDDMVSLAKQLPFLAGEEVPFDRVGWFYMRNNSADLTGYYNMHTGENNMAEFGALKYWNFNETNGAFEGDCGKIHGSAGEFFPPKQSRFGTISFFSPDMCRSVPLDYEKDVEIHGVTGYKFSGGPRSTDNGTIYPENWCYAPGEGTYSGVLNISSCRYGTPVFMSYPHFYGADSFYTGQVDGMNPSEEKHQFFMTLEPNTGIPIDVAARLQLNLLISPNPNVGIYADVPRHFMPILWFEQRVTATPELAEELAVALKVPMIGQICSIIVIVIGLILLLWFPVTKLIRRHIGQVHVSEKGVVKIITMEELEKQNKKQVENSPLLEKKDTPLKNVEFTKSSKQDLQKSMEKLPFIDSCTATSSDTNNQSNDKPSTISLSTNCDSNRTDHEQDAKTKL
ncbi:protein peste-like [Culicoides brevitarsis]|uniref:protein peste-like n=1 Tax=Culicoides brevitarsis TaxID=469753 RepID=UPI00307CB6A2